MATDFVFIVTYECPRCHAPLENRASGPPTWLRCPNCGRASLSPEFEKLPPKRHPVEPGEEIFTITEDMGAAALPFRPRPMAARPSSSPMAKAQMTRWMLGSGFFVTAILFLFSLLESNGIQAALTGVAALVLLFLLSRPISPNVRG